MIREEKQGKARASHGHEWGTRHPILILGVGNILLGDEGVGVHVVRIMQAQGALTNVEIIDGGTATLDLLDVLANRDKFIIIDAVKDGGGPGAVYRFSPDEIKTQNQCLTSVHQISLLDTLTMARLTGCMPREIVIFGIEPKKVDWALF